MMIPMLLLMRTEERDERERKKGGKNREINKLG